jgi:hypothetical protein
MGGGVQQQQQVVEATPVFFFPGDFGQIPLFYPKIGHKYLNL